MSVPMLQTAQAESTQGAERYQRWQIERRVDGVILVRVPSWDRAGRPLPDAVFSFRNGDPQFLRWDEFLRQRGE